MRAQFSSLQKVVAPLVRFLKPTPSVAAQDREHTTSKDFQHFIEVVIDDQIHICEQRGRDRYEVSYSLDPPTPSPIVDGPRRIAIDALSSEQLRTLLRDVCAQFRRSRPDICQINIYLRTP